jgi:hypothetical protein
MTYQYHARSRRNQNLQRRQRRESRGVWVTLALALVVAGGGGVAYWHQMIRPASTTEPAVVAQPTKMVHAAHNEPAVAKKPPIRSKSPNVASKPLPVDPRMILADPLRADEHEAAREAIRRQEQAALAASATVTDPVAPPPPDTIVSEFFGMTVRESDFSGEASPTDVAVMSGDGSQQQAMILPPERPAPATEPTAWQSFTAGSPK